MISDSNRMLSLQRYAPNPSKEVGVTVVVSTNQDPLKNHVTSLKDGDKMGVLLTDEYDYVQPGSAAKSLNYPDLVVGSCGTEGRSKATRGYKEGIWSYTLLIFPLLVLIYDTALPLRPLLYGSILNILLLGLP